jgi:hypothetical protein
VKPKVKVVIGCQFCGHGCKEGEVATLHGYCIQSPDGAFVCKTCWKKIKALFSADSILVLQGAEPHDDEDVEP